MVLRLRGSRHAAIVVDVEHCKAVRRLYLDVSMIAMFEPILSSKRKIQTLHLDGGLLLYLLRTSAPIRSHPSRGTELHLAGVHLVQYTYNVLGALREYKNKELNKVDLSQPTAKELGGENNLWSVSSPFEEVC